MNLATRFHDYVNSFGPAERGGYVKPQMANGMVMTYHSIKPLQTDRERRLSWINNQLGEQGLNMLGFKPSACEKICDWIAVEYEKDLKERELND